MQGGVDSNILSHVHVLYVSQAYGTSCVVSIMQMVNFFGVKRQRKSYLICIIEYDGESALCKSMQTCAICMPQNNMSNSTVCVSS